MLPLILAFLVGIILGEGGGTRIPIEDCQYKGGHPILWRSYMAQ